MEKENKRLRFMLNKARAYNKLLILRLKMCGVRDIIELRFDEDEHPRDDKGKFVDKSDAGNGGKTKSEPSVQGANELEHKGFKNKQALNNHWKNGRTHADEYEKDGITTKEQYEKRAVELAEMKTGGDISGHLDKNGHIVRYDAAKNDFVKADIKKGVLTMFKPEDGKKYYENIKKGDIEHGGKA